MRFVDAVQAVALRRPRKEQIIPFILAVGDRHIMFRIMI
jgi:hypothetical protein